MSYFSAIAVEEVSALRRVRRWPLSVLLLVAALWVNCATSQNAAQKPAPGQAVSPARPYTMKGMKLFHDHKVKESIEAFNMAIAADPNDPDAYFGLGTALGMDALAHNKDKEETALAAEKFRKYLQLAPNGFFAEASRNSLDAMGFPVDIVADKASNAQATSEPSSTRVPPTPTTPPTAALASPRGQATGDSFAALLAGPVGPLRFNAGIGYVAPAGWSVSQENGMAVMSRPMPQSEGPCAALLLPPQPAQADLVAQAYGIASQLFARFGRLTGDLGRDIRQSLYQGVSGKGWEYVELFGNVGDDRLHADGRILLARVGGQVVPLAAITKSGKCLGNRYYRENDNWALLFHSLQLPGYADDSPLLGQQLLGEWESVGSTTFSSKTYAANGHFGRLDAHSTYTESSRPGFILQKTSSWEGDGAYEVHGDRLTSHPNTGDFAGRTITELFSIVRRPNNRKPGGFEWMLQVVSRADEPTQGMSGNGNFVYTLVKQ